MESIKWYVAKTGNDQGLVVAEKSGKNVAVTYDKTNAQLIAAAPEMLEALIAIHEHLCEEMDEAEALDHALDGHDGETCVLCAVGEAIDKATARIPDCVC